MFGGNRLLSKCPPPFNYQLSTWKPNFIPLIKQFDMRK